MNKIEVLKMEKDGLAIKEDIARFAELGWELIPDEDIQRLKWHGIFLRNPTPGFFMIRVRIPGGRTTTEQMRTLAYLAKTYGNGLLDMTTRQQLQLRQLKIEHVPEAFLQMEDAGLTSLQTGMDNVRNIMTCPVAGRMVAMTSQSGCGTIRKYGFGAFQPSGNRFLASSSETAGTMITSSP